MGFTGFKEVRLTDDNMIRGRRLTDLESHIFNERQDLNYGVNNETLNEVLKPFYINKPVKDKWFELLCYYHRQTETYDRSLTNLRSPYDQAEACISHPHIRNLSTNNAIYIRRLIDKIAIAEGIQKDNNKHIYLSAQGWINEYLVLKSKNTLIIKKGKCFSYSESKNSSQRSRWCFLLRGW